MKTELNGVLIIHASLTLSRSAPEEIILRRLGYQAIWDERGRFSNLIFEFTADYDTCMAVVVDLSKCADLWFELLVLQGDTQDGERWVFDPQLGLGSVRIDSAGNQLVVQDHIEQLIKHSAGNLLKFERELNRVLLKPWDDRFEDLREERLRQRARIQRVS